MLEALLVIAEIIFIIIIFLPFSCTNATGRISGPILTKKNTQMQLKGYIGPLKILRLSDQGLRGDNSKLIHFENTFFSIRFFNFQPIWLKFAIWPLLANT